MHPLPMKIWHYDPESQTLLPGPNEDGSANANPSPLEPGVYLIPRYATDVPYPTVAPPDGQYYRFTGDAWQATDLPADRLVESSTPEQESAARAAVAKQRLADSAWAAATDVLDSLQNAQEFRAYRQALITLIATGGEGVLPPEVSPTL